MNRVCSLPRRLLPAAYSAVMSWSTLMPLPFVLQRKVVSYRSPHSTPTPGLYDPLCSGFPPSLGAGALLAQSSPGHSNSSDPLSGVKLCGPPLPCVHSAPVMVK